MTTDFAALRTKMVDGQVRTTDVTDIAILDAMLSVTREEFVPEGRKALAYLDEDIPVAPATSAGGGRYLMEPSPFARLVQLAEITPHDHVLIIGCATGYSAAVLSQIGGSVVALEEHRGLFEKAGSCIARLGYQKVDLVQGPLVAGWAAGGPYDVILVEGAVTVLPEALFDQMREGGRLAVVEGSGNTGVAKLYVKADGMVSARRGFNAAVKPLPGFERVEEFQF